jgi:hypothetical protein
MKCPNCETVHEGNFCPHCGQSTTDFNQPFREIFGDFLNATFNLDSRLLRTLFPLLFRPGVLTREFLAGRRVRYISPSRLYFVSSFFFFLLLTLVGLRAITTSKDVASPTGDTSVIAFGSPEEVESMVDSIDFPHEETLPTEPAAPDSSELTEEGDFTVQVEGFDGVMETAKRKISEDPRVLLDGMVDTLPFAIFLLLPVFALLLKLFYVRRGIHYVTHLVFSLNLHAFFFLFASILMLLNTILPDSIDSIRDLVTILYLGGYFFIALKVVYGQSYLKTAGKWCLVTLSYLAVLLGASFGLILVTLFLIGYR